MNARRHGWVLLVLLLILLGVAAAAFPYVVPPNTSGRHGWTQDPSNPPPTP